MVRKAPKKSCWEVYKTRQTNPSIDGKIERLAGQRSWRHLHAKPGRQGPIFMTVAASISFNPEVFLATTGLGRRIVELKAKQHFFSQGDPADAVFYLQRGSAKVTVISKAGKEATITLLSEGDFIGEEALAGVDGLRLATATAVTACTALKIMKEEMAIHAMHEGRHVLRRISRVSAGSQHAHAGRPGGSALQFQ